VHYRCLVINSDHEEAPGGLGLAGLPGSGVDRLDLERPVLRPAQSRMARAALQWSLNETAQTAGVSYRIIFRLENEQRGVHAEKLVATRQSFGGGSSSPGRR